MSHGIYRRDFLKAIGVGAAAVACNSCEPRYPDDIPPPNVLLITIDDMNQDSVGTYGCSVPEITPNIDAFASEGIRFEHAHVNISVCQPCRAVVATGRYPHRNGVIGFEHTTLAIPTVMQSLKKAGYRTGIMSKVDHSTPHEDFPWDSVVESEALLSGRSPERYRQYATQFFEECKTAGTPFYFMVNIEDPHRPFYKPGNTSEPTVPSRTYSSGEVPVPEFLPDLPDIRTEVSRYFNSVRRADDTVGAVLQALRDSGYEDQTMVILISDNGMSFPFSKANCYPSSTKTPWIIRWPDVVEPGSVDTIHFVSTVDIMPTILDAVGLPIPDGLDGASSLPILTGRYQWGRRRVFTQFNRTISLMNYPMRSVQDKDYCYIFNPWSDGVHAFQVEAHSGITFRAMVKAAKNDAAIASRVEMLQYRTLEELYDLKEDPHCLTNLANDPSRRTALQERQKQLYKWMISNDDPALSCFENRYEPESCRSYAQTLERGVVTSL